MNLSFFTEGNDAVLQLDIVHSLDDLYRFNAEVVLASLMDVNLLLFGRRLIEGGSCWLNYPRPAHAAAYEALFGNQIRFDAGANQLRFRKKFLDLPISLSNPVARRVAEAQCQEEMRSLEAVTSIAERVRRVLESVRDGRHPGIDNVATQLGMSPRTLRRQLNAEGQKFQGILDGIHHRRSLELLRRTDLGIDEITYRLGYGDPSSFGRAFRKWKGISPSAWRERNA